MAHDAGAAVSITPKQEVLAEKISQLLAVGELVLIETRCVCGLSGDSTVIAQVDRYGLPMQTVVCSGCGTLRANPYFDEQSLKRFYEDYYQELYARAPEPAVYFETQRRYGARVLGAIRTVAPESKFVIEVGCGAGGALATLAAAGLSVAGCDHSERLVRFGQSKQIANLVIGDISNLIDSVPHLKNVDVVYLHHVFEHITDPADFLKTCRPLLSSVGAIVVIVPDISRIDKFPFPGGDVRLFLHIAHKYNYSLSGLELLGRANGYSTQFIDQYESTIAPEFWVVFRPQTERQSPEDRNGKQMLPYLRRTETRYQLGMLPGYQSGAISRVKRLAKTLLQARVLRSLFVGSRKLRIDEAKK